MVPVTSRESLEAHIKIWEDDSVPDNSKAVGFILSLKVPIHLFNYPIWKKLTDMD
jgi:hypothetical protein